MLVIAKAPSGFSFFNEGYIEKKYFSSIKGRWYSTCDRWVTILGVASETGDFTGYICNSSFDPRASFSGEEILATLAEGSELMKKINLAMGVGTKVLEYFMTHGGSNWCLVETSDGVRSILYEGHRNRFNTHTVGWYMPTEWVSPVPIKIWSTLPETAKNLFGDGWTVEEIFELPKPEGWRPPEMIDRCLENEE